MKLTKDEVLFSDFEQTIIELQQRNKKLEDFYTAVKNIYAGKIHSFDAFLKTKELLQNINTTVKNITLNNEELKKEISNSHAIKDKNKNITKIEIATKHGGYYFKIYWEYRAFANLISVTYTSKDNVNKAIINYLIGGIIDSNGY